MRVWISRVVSVLALAACAAGGSGCHTNPATGQTIFAPVSSSQVAAMGAQAAPQLAAEFGGAVPNTQLQAYVSEIGQRLAKQTEGEFPGLQWEFTLLNSPVINAFALPGGKVFMTRGLAEKMTNEAQLAGVLGHEVGHVTAEHIARRIGQQQLFSIGKSVAGVAVQSAGESAGAAGQLLMPALDVGGQLTLLKFGRDEESQADYLGMRYMSRLGYDPRAQLTVMEILKAEAGGGRQPEFLSTHPMPQTRIDRIQQLLKTDFANTQNNPNYALHEQRFQQQFLSVLRTLPPAPEPRPTKDASGKQLRASPERRPPGDVIGRPSR
jgi:predicted Zn-dependent protease